GQAYWVSAFQKTDDWNEQFFSDPTTGPLKEIYPHAGIQYLKNEAQAIGAPAPVAEVLQDSLAGNERLLRLRLFSPRGAAHLELTLQSASPDDLLGVRLQGEQLQLEPIEGEGSQVYFMRLHGLPLRKEATLELRLRPQSQLTLYLTDQSIGLPEELVQQPKPAHVVAEQGRDSNLTVVRKSYSF
ncbi:MAG: metallopeptidase, partial [Hymenobacteraceae bacterium]|nr:metallopeptidase [Hymenobacteraceae bacterium]